MPATCPPNLEQSKKKSSICADVISNFQSCSTPLKNAVSFTTLQAKRFRSQHRSLSLSSNPGTWGLWMAPGSLLPPGSSSSFPPPHAAGLSASLLVLTSPNHSPAPPSLALKVGSLWWEVSIWVLAVHFPLLRNLPLNSQNRIGSPTPLPILTCLVSLLLCSSSCPASPPISGPSTESIIISGLITTLGRSHFNLSSAPRQRRRPAWSALDTMGMGWERSMFFPFQMLASLPLFRTDRTVCRFHNLFPDSSTFPSWKCET